MRCLGDWLYGCFLGTLAGCLVLIFFGQDDEYTWLVTVFVMALAVTGMVFLFLFDPGGDT